jgi:hypothetical protein
MRKAWMLFMLSFFKAAMIFVGLQSDACRDNYASNIDHRRR